MVKTLLIISLVLMIGAAGATVAAAQAGQPGEPMYSIKVLTEQARTILQTRPQAQAAQVTHQASPVPGQQERDRLRLQVQDVQQTRERDHTRLQTQDTLQTQERIRQSQNSGQRGQAAGDPWVNDVPTSGNAEGPNLGRGNNDTCIPHSQNCDGGQPTPGYGNRP